MQQSIVLHADILGFSNIIKKSNDETNDETLNRLKSILKISNGFLDKFKSNDLISEVRVNYKLFSDNLYASFSYKDAKTFSDAFETCIIFSRIYFQTMLENKLLIRGGISFGNDYSDDSIIFSYALIKAYELECKATYPRIVIDNELLNRYLDKNYFSSYFKDLMTKSIIKDQNDFYFINPCGYELVAYESIDKLEAKKSNDEFINKCIKYSRGEINKLDRGKEDENKIIQKYEYLIDVLFWNQIGRNIITNKNNFNFITFTIRNE